MPPRFLLEKVVTQMRRRSPIRPARPACSPSRWKISRRRCRAADRKRLHDAIIAAIDSKVRPAYRKLAEFVANDYAPQGRTEPGMWSLPNGDALYRFDVEQQTTTTDRRREEIHQLGLAEVKRIEGEHDRRSPRQLGYKDLASDSRGAEEGSEDPRDLAPADRRPATRTTSRRCSPKLPKLFGLLPKTKVEVMPVEEFREKEASGAQYNQGTPDGKRPGTRLRQHQRLRQSQRCSTSKRPRTTRAFPAITCRSRSRRRCPSCRRSASRPTTPPTSKAGRCMPSASARRSVSTRIRSPTTAISPTSCCAPIASCSTPACTTSTGRASRWWTSSTQHSVAGRADDPVRDRPLHRLAGPGAGVQDRAS